MLGTVKRNCTRTQLLFKMCGLKGVSSLDVARCKSSAKLCSSEIIFAKSYSPSDVQHVTTDLRVSSISQNALKKREFVLSGH